MNPAGFSVIVIGVDGNVDMVSQKVEGAQRILDIINNNGQLQGEHTGPGWEADELKFSGFTGARCLGREEGGLPPEA